MTRYVVTATSGGRCRSVHLAGGPGGWRALCSKWLSLDTKYGLAAGVTCQTCIRRGWGPLIRSAIYELDRAALVADAAEAVERFGEDELEAYARNR